MKDKVLIFHKVHIMKQTKTVNSKTNLSQKVNEI